MSKLVQQSFICTACQRRLFSTSQLRQSQTFRSTTATPKPPRIGAAKLSSSRRLILIHGPDAPKFLNGVTINKIPDLGHKEGFYSGFLTAQGRVLYDVFIYPTQHSSSFTQSSFLANSSNKSDPSYFIECDASSIKSLFSHIKKYKLRSKFTHRLIDGGEADVWSLWGKGLEGVDIGCLDHRAPGMGLRVVLFNGDTIHNFNEGDVDETTLHQQYTIRRYESGVAEGQGEIWEGTSLPQESNMDYMGGIDYRKGCYVGQELTIRTHHTGVVRKRILPIQLFPRTSPILLENPSAPVYDPDVQINPVSVQASISRVEKKGRSAGKLCGSVGNVGLALCRLEMMTDTSLPGGVSSYTPEDEFKVDCEGAEGMVKIKAFVPEWHRVGIVEDEAL